MMNSGQQEFLSLLRDLISTMGQVCEAGHELTMGNWVAPADDEDVDDEPEITIDHPCGTAACIMGWHAIAILKRSRWFDANTKACALSNDLDRSLYLAFHPSSYKFGSEMAAFVYSSSPWSRKSGLNRVLTRVRGKDGDQAVGALRNHIFNSHSSQETPENAVSYLRAIYDAFKALWSK